MFSSFWVSEGFFSVKIQVTHFFQSVLASAFSQSLKKQQQTQTSCPSQTYFPSVKLFISCSCNHGAEQPVLKKDIVQVLPDSDSNVCSKVNHFSARTFLSEEASEACKALVAAVS